MAKMDKNKVVLAYSGGLDTSVIAHWLMEKGLEVVAYELNIGQDEDLEAAKQKAHDMGIKEVHVIDAVKPFVEEFIFPALMANAVYEHQYLGGTSIARPLIAREQIKIAQKVGAGSVSHGATGKGNDQVRFEKTYQALMPDVNIIAPWKMQEFLDEFNGRQDMLDYAKEHGIPVEAKKGKTSVLTGT